MRRRWQLDPNYNFLRRAYWFGQVETRALAVFRLAFGLVLLKDAVYHLPLVKMFYSDAGWLPRSTLAQLARTWRFSLLDWLGPAWQVQLFVLAWIGVVVCLTLGYRTRWMAVLNFLALLSIHERNTYVLDGADVVFQVLSFWTMFTPLGDYYSLDALRARRDAFRRHQDPAALRVSAQPKTTYAFPVRLAQIQVGLVYLASALVKLRDAPWREGDALYLALQLKSYTLPTGDWLWRVSPEWLLKGLSYEALLAELLFVFLVFAPVWQPQLKLIGLSLTTFLHVGIALVMSIPNFSVVMLAAYGLFLDSRWVTGLERRLRQATTPIFLPKGAGGGLHPWAPVLAGTGEEAVAVLDSAESSFSACDDWWVCDGAGRRYDGLAAWQQLAARLPLSRLWAWTVRRRAVRQILWWLRGRWVQTCLKPLPARAGRPWAPRLRVVGQAGMTLGLSVCLFCVLWINARGAFRPYIPRISGWSQDLVLVTGLAQYWAMFGGPSRGDGWLIVDAELSDGSHRDLLTGQPVSTQFRRWLWGPWARWKDLTQVVIDYPAIQAAMGEYFCRQGGNSAETNILRVTLRHRFWTTQLPGEPRNTWHIQEHALWTGDCAP